MRRKIVIEGALFFVIGFLGIVEGLRIGFQKDAQAIQGMVGPGAYLLFPSLLLMITGIVYFFRNFRNRKTPKGIVEASGRKVLTFGIIMVLALYIVLMDVCGYLLASVVFFILEFRILGIQSWLKILFLTGIIVAFNYIVFVEFFSMSLPRGILFR
jgi:putative tricarboxylic transport membrane protein